MADLPKKFDCCVIDFETATHYNNSACSIGMAFIKDLEIVDRFYSLIQPPGNRYAQSNIRVHGITSKDTATAPTFGELWSEIESKINSSRYISAYNSQFDMGVLLESARHYGIKVPEFKTFDAMFCNPSYRNQVMKLSTLARQFGFTFEAHNAMDDAEVTAKILIETMKEYRMNDFDEFLKRHQVFVKPISRYNTTTANHFKPKCQKFKKSLKITDVNQVPPKEEYSDHWLQSKNVVLTGEFETGKDELMMKVRYHGAILKSTVSKTTDVLIEGWQDPKYQDENGLVEKQRKARQLLEEGHSLMIMSEADLLAQL
ncbi:exonuclease domain-containing protein [Globicatella sanguinis]